MAYDETSIPKTVTAETVTYVRHWSDTVFQIRTTRPPALRFRSGEFVMAGLMIDGKPLLRAYSIASPAWDEEIELYSIKVPDGPLTSHLQHIAEGQKILIGRKPTGTLVLDALLPGKRLFMIATGTGIAPFASLMRDPDSYERYEQLILAHTCRSVGELGYGLHLTDTLKDDPLVGDFAPERFHYFPTTTREASARMGRITDLMRSGAFFQMTGLGPFDPASDRVMICGSMAMLRDVASMCEALGFTEGSNNQPADYVIEKAFVS